MFRALSGCSTLLKPIVRLQGPFGGSYRIAGLECRWRGYAQDILWFKSRQVCNFGRIVCSAKIFKLQILHAGVGLHSTHSGGPPHQAAGASRAVGCASFVWLRCRYGWLDLCNAAKSHTVLYFLSRCHRRDARHTARSCSEHWHSWRRQQTRWCSQIAMRLGRC